MNKIYDTIIVGSGPAGMTAAIYLKRNNLNVCVFEGYAPGGQMVNTEVTMSFPAASQEKQASIRPAM